MCFATNKATLILLLALAVLPASEKALAAPPPATAPAMPLKDVRTFMYQLQGLEKPGAVAALAQSDYDLLIVEPTATLRDQKRFDAAAMVAALHAGKKGRIVLAYLDAGQAEAFRAYWQAAWKPPTKAARGSPDFLLLPDPDGWSEDYNVAFWDPRWQEIFATGQAAPVRQAMAAGFDGVYLDWIDAYDDEAVAAHAQKQRIDPARAMVDFLRLIRQTARAQNPAALVVQQNAIELLDADPRLLEVIDALGVEDTWFGGKANAPWGSKGAGDVPNRDKDESSTAARLRQYAKFRRADRPVFTIDYCRDSVHAAQVYRDAAAHDLVPVVTQVALDRITQTPPPALKK